MSQTVHMRYRYTQRVSAHMNYAVVHNSNRLNGNVVKTGHAESDSAEGCWEQVAKIVSLESDLEAGVFKIETRVVGYGDPKVHAANGRKFWTEAQAATYNMGFLQRAVTDSRDLHDYSAEGVADAAAMRAAHLGERV